MLSIIGGIHMQISKELLKYIADADLHIKLESVDYSTSLREIVTVGYMIEQGGKVNE
jgi:hypothetical protein